MFFFSFHLRASMEEGLSHQDIQILHPINLSLSVSRNLAASWFHKLPILEITGYLDTMNVSLMQLRLRSS